jgi:AraC family transcriptional regulator of adaptative response/methylated-DNA-[protein]-cysteine methyltransferase
MQTQDELDYHRIAAAITYLRENFRNQPSLDELASQAGLSPSHFQRVFTEWAGVSPKKFLQYLTLQYARKLLKEDGATILDTTIETGLSGTGRLHDLFINIEAMTPGEYRNGGADLIINYSFAHSPFGNILVASTPRGICHLAFVDEQDSALADLMVRFPAATFNCIVDHLQQNALFIFTQQWDKLKDIKLHLRASPFQLKVWETLLKIPAGRLTTYGTIASTINAPKAARAVGTAIGDNPIAFLIPCHRIIQSSGALGGYAWGLTRKSAIIGWEAARLRR